MAEVPALPFAAEIAEARARADASREARSLLPMVGIALTQLEVLAGLPSVPEGYPLPGDDLFDALGRPESDDLEGRRAWLARLSAELGPLAARHLADQAALDGLLAKQQEAMFDPACRPTIAVLKELGAEQVEVGQHAGRLRHILGQLEPLVALLDDPGPVHDAALAQIATLLDATPDPAALPHQVVALNEKLRRLEVQEADVDRRIRALTG